MYSQKNLFLTDRSLSDLNPLIAGEHFCPPKHSFGPAVRGYTLLHYVVSGKGTFYARDQVFSVEAGQVFLIRPGEVTTYTADAQDPWHYRWIGFNGNLSPAFSQLPAVFPVEEHFFRLDQFSIDPGVTEYRLAAALMELYASLFTKESHGNPHVRRVENYIRSQYMQPLRVDGIAKELCLDRRYLVRLFKEHTGCTIQEFLIRVRLEAAMEHLRHGASVKEAAALCGYEDVANFTKMFTRHYGIPPVAGRR